MARLKALNRALCLRTEESSMKPGSTEHFRPGLSEQSKMGPSQLCSQAVTPDDEDHGAEIIYTGRGGRDNNTGRQIADQEFEGQNAALVASRRDGLPVRVVRGADHPGPYSPQLGYRYDGLYWVDDHWRERGRDGFEVCRYHLVNRSVRLDEDELPADEKGPAERRPSTILRIIRDTVVAKRVKGLHNHRCQVCD